ncbi:hypothetical protein DPMN_086899 [Dreissena polymorpha]|uniref:Uncharacterized protein n=1 Tax=Dreissena polymorpha TaxID=45954 RepID=A0A9D4KR89_DREPO|nr:hypothetical protein DPMN_086899 [Dreissena polymorpha]
MPRPIGSHVFQANIIIFELIQDIIETNLLTKFHEDWTINVASRPYKEKFPAPGGHVFKATKNIFELIQDIIGTNLQTYSHAFLPIQTILELNCHIQKTHVLTKFHEHWTKNVTSRVFPCFHYIHIEKTASPPGGHVFSPIWTIFELFQELIKAMKTAQPTGGHVFQHTGTSFELNKDIIKTNILTNFELGRDFTGAKLLTKFHEDGTRNVASRVLRANVYGRTKIRQKSSPEQSAFIELPGGFARLDPLAGLCPAPNRGPSRPWTPSKSFNILNPPQPEILDPSQL